MKARRHYSAPAERSMNEPFPTSSALVFDGLKDADRGDDRGGSARAATELSQ
jgi:hypothetical protein